jgi:hypothetical protein
MPPPPTDTSQQDYTHAEAGKEIFRGLIYLVSGDSKVNTKIVEYFDKSANA